MFDNSITHLLSNVKGCKASKQVSDYEQLIIDIGQVIRSLERFGSHGCDALYQGTTLRLRKNALYDGHGFSRAVKSHSNERYRVGVGTRK
jgi:hypothetical protein